MPRVAGAGQGHAAVPRPSAAQDAGHHRRLSSAQSRFCASIRPTSSSKATAKLRPTDAAKRVGRGRRRGAASQRRTRRSRQEGPGAGRPARATNWRKKSNRSAASCETRSAKIELHEQRADRQRRAHRRRTKSEGIAKSRSSTQSVNSLQKQLELLDRSKRRCFKFAARSTGESSPGTSRIAARPARESRRRTCWKWPTRTAIGSWKYDARVADGPYRQGREPNRTANCR